MSIATTGPNLQRLKSALLLLTAALIWGSAFVGQLLGMASVGPLTFTAARFVLGALLVAPLAWREWQQIRRSGRALSGSDFRGIGLLGTVLFAAVILQQMGLVSTTATNAGFLTVLYVPMVPLMYWLLRRHVMHWSVWPASLGCVVGTWLLSGAGGVTLSVGDTWILACTVPCAWHLILVGQLAKRIPGMFVLAFGQFVVCALWATVLALATEPISLNGLRQAAGTIAYTGIMSVGIAFTLQVLGQRHAHPADSAIVLSSEALFAALFGALLLGERMAPTGLIGGGMILVSIIAVQLLPLLRRRTLATV